MPPSQLPCRGRVEGASGTPGPSGAYQATIPVFLLLVNRIKHEQEGYPSSKQLSNEPFLFVSQKTYLKMGPVVLVSFAGGRRYSTAQPLGRPDVAEARGKYLQQEVSTQVWMGSSTERE